MSHSTVLVIGENPEEQLEPFFEQGEPGDYFMEFSDRTDELKADYEKDTQTHVLNPETGKWVKKSYDFMDGRAQEGWEEKEVPVKECYPTWTEYAREYCGYQPDDEGRYGYWYNPNAKWDWYQLGGRWTGLLKLKRTINSEARVGSAGLMTKEAGWGYADQARIEDIDLEGMQEEARVKAEETYDKFEAVTKGLEVPPTWEQVRKSHPDDIDAARAEWRSYPWVKAMQQSDLDVFFGDTHDYYCVNTGGREAYVERCKAQAFSTFAVLKDGQWYERGSMGWWGVVSDEKDTDNWQEEFNKLVLSLPGDTLISVYDVHI